MTTKQAHLDELFRLFAKPRTAKESEKLLRDLLTPHELDQVAERLQIVKRLVSGMSQRDVKDDLAVSIEKVTRGAKAWRSSKGGFKLAF